jgi:hypothetical protein
VHPVIAQAIITERTRDMHAQAAARGLARCLRRYRHRAHAAPAATPAVFEPCSQPAALRLV